MPGPRRQGWRSERPELVAAGGRLPDLPAQLRRLQRGRDRRPAGRHVADPVLVALGVDAVWLSPFYPSALADGGYDVDDYRDVDPRLGHAGGLRRDVAALHAAGIRLVVDIVPNHSSDRHAWFREALAAARARRRGTATSSGTDRARTAPAAVGLGVACSAGRHGRASPDGQWYLHMFAPEQPDLNWDNREVRDDFLTTLRFWSDRGVDGFRVDVAHGLAKDLTEPLRDLADPHRDLSARRRTRCGTATRCTRSTPSGGRCSTSTTRRAPRSPRRGSTRRGAPGTRARRAGPGLQLRPARGRTGTPQQFRDGHQRQPGAGRRRPGRRRPGCFSNHDVVRHATRYGLPQAPSGERTRTARSGCSAAGGAAARRRARDCGALAPPTLLMLALPGSAYLYQGEELGLHEVGDIPDGILQDPAFRRSGGNEKGRDGCRVPLPWTIDGPSFGFGPGTPTCRSRSGSPSCSVEAEEREPDSVLSLYRRALELRRGCRAAETLDWVGGHGEVLHFTRPGGWHSVTNFGAEPVPLPPGEVLISSAAPDGGELPGETTAWMTEPTDRNDSPASAPATPKPSPSLGAGR